MFAEFRARAYIQRALPAVSSLKASVLEIVFREECTTVRATQFITKQTTKHGHSRPDSTQAARHYKLPPSTTPEKASSLDPSCLDTFWSIVDSDDGVGKMLKINSEKTKNSMS